MVRGRLVSVDHTRLLSTVSGYEVLVVALATVGLVVLVISALLGVLNRLVRGHVEEPEPVRRRRWGRRSPSGGPPSTE